MKHLPTSTAGLLSWLIFISLGFLIFKSNLLGLQNLKTRDAIEESTSRESIFDSREHPLYGNLLAKRNGTFLYYRLGENSYNLKCDSECEKDFKALIVNESETKTISHPEISISFIEISPDKFQVAVENHPLYTYVGDHLPFDSYAQGKDGEWFIQPYVVNKRLK